MSLDSLNWWTLNVDRASQQTGAGIGLQLKSPAGEKIEQAICLGFSASNNELEYEAILAGIELAATVSVDKLLIQSDSQLVVGQVNAEYESRETLNVSAKLGGTVYRSASQQIRIVCIRQTRQDTYT